VPVEGDFVTLDIDGGILPSDWYLQLAGEAGKMLCGQIPLSENTLPCPLPGQAAIVFRLFDDERVPCIFTPLLSH
jgi:hypothetical protein